jgi:hypothetical protein
MLLRESVIIMRLSTPHLLVIFIASMIACVQPIFTCKAADRHFLFRNLITAIFHRMSKKYCFFMKQLSFIQEIYNKKPLSFNSWPKSFVRNEFKIIFLWNLNRLFPEKQQLWQPNQEICPYYSIRGWSFQFFQFNYVWMDTAQPC